MRLDIILGLNMDTNKWIEKIKSSKDESLIIVIDFEYEGRPFKRSDVTFLSSQDGISISKNFKEIYYYKSLYAYPFAGDAMSSLYKE